MKTINEKVDVVVAGGGTAGHVAALQAARAGVNTSVIEAGTMLGGTMTSGGVYMPNHFFSTEGPVVLGIAWELYKKSIEIEGLPIPDFRKRRPVENPGYYSAKFHLRPHYQLEGVDVALSLVSKVPD